MPPYAPQEMSPLSLEGCRQKEPWRDGRCIGKTKKDDQACAWKDATRERLDLLELLPALAKLCPPAAVLDKTFYSAFSDPQLLQLLRAREAEGLIITGSETDVCVLATVLAAVDLGYRVILVSDAVCSSTDEGHDALMKMYHQRYTEQIEVADAATVIKRWEQ